MKGNWKKFHPEGPFAKGYGLQHFLSITSGPQTIQLFHIRFPVLKIGGFNAVFKLEFVFQTTPTWGCGHAPNLFYARTNQKGCDLKDLVELY